MKSVLVLVMIGLVIIYFYNIIIKIVYNTIIMQYFLKIINIFDKTNAKLIADLI